jgi:hypothetical protein
MQPGAMPVPRHLTVTSIPAVQYRIKILVPMTSSGRAYERKASEMDAYKVHINQQIVRNCQMRNPSHPTTYVCLLAD